MSAQRNSQNGKMKAPDFVHADAMQATEDTSITTTPKTVVAIIAGCIGAAILWSTLSIKVSADSGRIDKVETVTVEIKDKSKDHGFQIDKIETRIFSIEEWRKDMQQQREDIKAIRFMLEEQARARKP
jgi:hypothetical protein